MLASIGTIATARIAIVGVFAIALLLLWQSPVSIKIPMHSSEPTTNKIVAPAAFSENLFSKPSRDHPVFRLATEAARQHREKLARQSQTYEEAVAEYEHRYNREPPPGFEHWFEFAQEHESPIIDDYDVLSNAITPFLRRSGSHISDTVAEILRTGGSVHHCEIRNHEMTEPCGVLSEDIKKFLNDSKILDHVPDTAMLIDAMDEPRVIMNYDFPEEKFFDGQSLSPVDLNWTNTQHMNSWKELYLDRCPEADAPEELNNVASEVQDLASALITNHDQSLSLCQHKEYRDKHAFLVAPSNLIYTTAAVPALSPAVISTMNDIPFPAIAYTLGMYSYSEEESVEYEKKTPRLYWAGKTTGGFQKPTTNGKDEWMLQHRQRFVRLANDMDAQNYTYLARDAAGNWTPFRDRLNMTNYHVNFTGVVQCDDAACQEIKDYFTIIPGEPRAESMKHTLLFDADGNGHSARYYRYLQSKSLPLKQTLFREWHDDRLQAWLHFVPISIGMQELPEVVRYLVEEEEGRQLARKLGMAGKEWAQQCLRPIDQVIYIYRMLLELARLQDQERMPSIAS